MATRKLKLQVQMTPEGLIAGPNGEMDFMTWNWGDDIKDYVSNLTDSIDCIIMGKNMSGGFIPHWEGVAVDAENPEQEFGKLMVDTSKVVFSRSLESIEGKNTKLAKGDLKAEVNELKSENGKDIIVYGGASFVSALVNESLIDDYYLFVNPAAIGKGMSIFGNLNQKLNLELVESKSFDCGIVLLHYRPKP